MSTIVRIEGICYKIGAHGFAYQLLNGDWVRTSKPKHLITKAQEKAEQREKVV